MNKYYEDPWDERNFCFYPIIIKEDSQQQINNAINNLNVFDDHINGELKINFKNLMVIYNNSIYENLLSIVIKNKNNIYFKIQHQNHLLYDLCLKKMKQIGLLHKLFYFNLINKEHNNFIEYFRQFIPIFLTEQYDDCWNKYNYKLYIPIESFSFMQEYLDYYKYKTNEDVSQFQNKLTSMLQSNDYSYIGDNSRIFLNV